MKHHLFVLFMWKLLDILEVLLFFYCVFSALIVRIKFYVFYVISRDYLCMDSRYDDEYNLCSCAFIDERCDYIKMVN